MRFRLVVIAYVLLGVAAVLLGLGVRGWVIPSLIGVAVVGLLTYHYRTMWLASRVPAEPALPAVPGLPYHTSVGE